jgi:MFS family permease
VDRASSPSPQSLKGLDWFTFFLGDIQTGFGPFMSVYLVTQKWTQTDIGLVLTVGSLASLLCQVPGGALVDAVRSERSAAAAAVVCIGMSAFMIAAWPIFLTVAIARILHAMASAVLAPAVAAITLGLVGRRALAKRFGRNACFASVGNGLAALLMGAGGYLLSAQAVFFVTAAFALPTLAALFQIKESDVNAADAHGGIASGPPAGILSGLRQLLPRRALWIFISCIALFQFANTPMLPLVGSELTVRSSNWAVTLVAVCIVVPQLLVALLSPLAGRLAQSWGRRPLLLLGFAALPLRGLLFAYSSNPLAVVGVQMLDGISAAVLGVLLPLVIADTTHGSGRYNLAQGISGMMVGLAAAFSTSATGYLADHFGGRTAFIGLAAAAGLSFSLLALLMPETRPENG